MLYRYKYYKYNVGLINNVIINQWIIFFNNKPISKRKKYIWQFNKMFVMKCNIIIVVHISNFEKNVVKI